MRDHQGPRSPSESGDLPPDPAIRCDLLVAVCAYRRPESLDALLTCLGEARSEARDLDARIAVIDNDPSGSAWETVSVLRNRGVDYIDYVAEPRQGLSFSHNRALDHALAARAEAIAFIDDDDVCGSDWMVKIWQLHRLHPDAVVSGPQITDLPDSAPEWLVASMIHQRTWPAEGSVISACATANSLIPTSVLGDVRFRECFNRSSGHDTDFFLRLGDRGVLIRFSAKAPVHEKWPVERCSLRYLVRRARRQGAGTSSIQMERDGRRAALRRVLSAGKSLALAVALAASGVATDRRPRFARACVYASEAFGTIEGIFRARSRLPLWEQWPRASSGSGST